MIVAYVVKVQKTRLKVITITCQRGVHNVVVDSWGKKYLLCLQATSYHLAGTSCPSRQCHQQRLERPTGTVTVITHLQRICLDVNHEGHDRHTSSPLCASQLVYHTEVYPTWSSAWRP